MKMHLDLGLADAILAPRNRIGACGRRSDAQLCQSAVDEIRNLVLDVGGVTEEEAELLLLVIRRLTKIQSREGAEAARRAAEAVRQTWIETSEDDLDP
jgi:hypothetical protein